MGGAPLGEEAGGQGKGARARAMTVTALIVAAAGANASAAECPSNSQARRQAGPALGGRVRCSPSGGASTCASWSAGHRRWPRGRSRRGVGALIHGGAERADSVRAGLARGRREAVLIHDAARPFCPAAVDRSPDRQRSSFSTARRRCFRSATPLRASRRARGAGGSRRAGPGADSPGVPPDALCAGL